MDIEQQVNIKDLNEERNSRMIAAHGLETQSKLMKMNVFLYGLRGVGVETAKNLILAGPSSVCIHDDEILQISDLGCNFCVKEDQVGKQTRAEASLQFLSDLNRSVKVSVHKGQLINKSNDQSSKKNTQQNQSEEENPQQQSQLQEIKQKENYPNLIDFSGFLSNFQVVVFTDCYDLDLLLSVNAFCRKQNIGFIATGNTGLSGFCFVDFGDNFVSFDQDGEETRSAIVFTVSNNDGEVTVLHRHGFQQGDYVAFREIQGMTELNSGIYMIKSVPTPTSFKLDCDMTKFSQYVSGGIVEQVKVQKKILFKSLQESINQPLAPEKMELDMCDFSKFGVPEQLHMILLALFQFSYQNGGKLPDLHSHYHAEELLHIAKQINTQHAKDQNNNITVQDIDENLVKNVALYARAQISPVASFWGGIVAQEIIKYTGKFTPLSQWLHHEMFEALPNQKVSTKPLGSRYDDFVAIFGHETLEKLAKKNVFLVGAGALGCEFLKQFALLGISSGNAGSLTVTDDDRIEPSNLSRQFLFRTSDIGKPKSQQALAAVGKTMNQRFLTNKSIQALQFRVSPENEHVFDDEFWQNLDFVVNAVDNINARLYVDQKCVIHKKALFESGTLGTKCNAQIILPDQTISYGESQDPPEEQIPLCTLKNFPYLIEHTIQWARDFFEGRFANASQDLCNYLLNRASFLSDIQNQLQLCKKGQYNELNNNGQTFLQRIELTKKLASTYLMGTYEACIKLAIEQFQEILHDQIAQLVHVLPQDHKDKFGQPFWVGTHRFPHAIKFSADDEQHIDFVQSAANVYAFMFGINYCTDRTLIKKIASTIQIKPFTPSSNVSIKTEQDNNNNGSKQENNATIDIDQEINKTEQIVRDLGRMLVKQLKSKPQVIQFEKDDSSNYHIDYLSALANLRASNYNISQVSKFKVKIIAGKIIPALATTTAMIVGAVGMEIIKYSMNKEVQFMKDSFMNLALPLFLFTEPYPPKIYKDNKFDVTIGGPVKAVPSKFTIWDQIIIQGPLTVQKLIDQFQQQYKLIIKDLTIGNLTLYNDYKQDKQKRLTQEIKQLFEQVQGAKLSDKKKFLLLTLSCVTDEKVPADAIIPLIKYII